MIAPRPALYGGVAAAVLLAGVAGFAVAKLAFSNDKPAETAAPKTPEADSGGHQGAVVMAATVIQASGIGIETVKAGGLASEILAQATVSATPGGQALITARAAGAVTRINVRLGDPVRVGQALAVVESREAAQIAADRLVADARARLAQRNLAREKSLYDQRVSPRVDLETAEAEAAAAAAESRRASVAASAAKVTGDGRGVVVASPITGRVTASTATLGAYVDPNTELFRVADPGKVQIEAALPGADASRVQAGDLARVEFADGRKLEGKVRSVTPALDAMSRTATAILDVTGAQLQPGQTARARIFPRGGEASQAIVVPDEAVQSVGGRDVVFARSQDGFRAIPVVRGQSSAGRTEIVYGLRAGVQIATRNAFLLKAELGKGAADEE